MSKLTTADKKKIAAMKLPAWVDREKDIQKVKVLGEDSFAITAELPARLRRDAKRFRPAKRAPVPVHLEVGQSIEVDGTFYHVRKTGSFSCRRVFNRRTKREVVVMRGRAILVIDREATEAFDSRYWRDAGKAQARPLA